MGETNIEVDYDEDEDFLYLSKSDEKSKFSVDISIPKGDIVIDFDYQGLVSGIEIFNASEHFPMVERFDKVRSVDLNVNYGSKWLMIQLLVYVDGLEQPLATNIYSPYSKELIVGEGFD